jgi:hypothetical protein
MSESRFIWLQKKVLIDQYHSPVISGYGMFNILGTSASSAAVFSSPIRFSPPEYFSDETGTASVRTRAGDVYAFSMVMLEVSDILARIHVLDLACRLYLNLSPIIISPLNTAFSSIYSREVGPFAHISTTM